MLKRIMLVAAVVWALLAVAAVSNAQDFDYYDLMDGAQGCILAPKDATEVTTDITKCLMASAYIRGVLDGTDQWESQMGEAPHPYTFEGVREDPEYIVRVLRRIYAYHTVNGTPANTDGADVLAMIHAILEARTYDR